MPLLTNQPYSKWRDRLLPIIEQTEQRNDHEFANQVDEALLSGRASLFLVADGFFVLEPSFIDGEMAVCVLFAYSFNKGSSAIYLPVMEKLAKEVGAKKLLFWTAVKKLHSVLVAHDFQKTESGHIDRWEKVI
ncbi:hypothetical protein [Vibrio metschnikovii]|uniref:hypothetical protein n=1 Tax=Vibrio metschnikovii TaxID=28172 RepID=UPI0027E58EEC|nr:hypothetical protein [Vibrio metschnikovii]